MSGNSGANGKESLGRCFSEIALLAAAAAVAAGAALLLSPTLTALEAIGYGLTAAVAVPCVDWLVRPWLRRRRGLLLIIRLALVVGTSVGLALVLPAKPEALFAQAVDVTPPEGVSDLRVSRSYVGGPGDTLTVFTFTATGAAVKQVLLAGRLVVSDEDLVDTYRRGEIDWLRFKDQALQLPEGKLPSRKMPVMKQPLVYRWQAPSGGPVESAVMLWDIESGSAVLVHWRG